MRLGRHTDEKLAEPSKEGHQKEKLYMQKRPQTEEPCSKNLKCKRQPTKEGPTSTEEEKPSCRRILGIARKVTERGRKNMRIIHSRKNHPN